MDIVDIKEYIKFDNPIIQSQGFSELVRVLKENKNDKLHLTKLNVFFDCLLDGNLHKWYLDSLAQLKDTGAVTNEMIFDETLSRIDKVPNNHIVLENIIEEHTPSISNFLKLTKRVSEYEILRALTTNSSSNKKTIFKNAILFASSIPNHLKLTLMDKEHHKYFEYFINNNPAFEKFYGKCCGTDDFVDLNTKIRIDPQEIYNIPKNGHLYFLPELIVQLQTRQQMLKIAENPRLTAEINNIKELILQSKRLYSPQTSELNSKIESIKRSQFSSIRRSDFLDLLILQNNADLVISTIYKCYDDVDIGTLPIEYILFIMPYCTDQSSISTCCEIIVKIISIQTQKANSIALYFISLFGKPFFEISRTLIINTLAGISINKYVLPIVVKFFCAMVQQPIMEKELIYTKLSNLVLKFPSILETVSPLVTSFSSNEQDELFEAKLNLARDCCISSDQCDVILSTLSKLMKLDHAKLSYVINVVGDLCINEVLETKTVHRQLSKNLKKIHSELPQISYCHFLRLGASEVTEDQEEDLEFRLECIRELMEFTKMNGNSETFDKIRSEAWVSLAYYDVNEIKTAIGIEFSNLLEKFHSFSEIEKNGFVQFLRKLLLKEIEILPRSLYNISNNLDSDVLPLFSKISHYKEMMGLNYSDESWYWKCNLSLAPCIIRQSSNKSSIAMKLIRSCALKIEPANSPEEMMELYASWRMCLRESMKCLMAAKNNDLIWARDHIVEEGKKCLMEGGQSVDNIMIMLTVLVGVIEELSKNLTDGEQMNEVIRNQKPWLISVFEFCATRLPKDIKHNRTQRANPIYQILTQSNKSSLHIALFSVKLLLRNTDVLDFYKNENIDLKDDFYDYIMNREDEVNEEKIPKTLDSLWIHAEAYGFHKISIYEVEKKLEAKFKRTTNYDEMLECLSTCENVKEYFDEFCVARIEDIVRTNPKFKKVMEKLWNNSSEEIRRTIYQGLSRVALVTERRIPKIKPFINHTSLSESSLLRQLYLKLRDEKFESEDVLRILPALIEHKRSDSRGIPSMDWSRIIEKISRKMNSLNEEQDLCCLKFTFEQEVDEIIYQILLKVNNNSCEEIYKVFSQYLSSVFNFIPRLNVINLLRSLISFIRSSSNEQCVQFIKNQLKVHQKNPVVKSVLKSELPDFNKSAHLLSPILDCLDDAKDFVGKISMNFDFWVEARKAESMDIKYLCELYDLVNDEEKRNVMIIILMHEARKLSNKMKVEKVLDAITSSRISRSCNKDMNSYLPIVLALLIVPNSHILPEAHFIGMELEVKCVISSCLKPFIDHYLNLEEMQKNIIHIASFLSPYLDKYGDVCEDWQRSTAKYLLLTILARFPENVLPCIETETDSFWFKLLL